MRKGLRPSCFVLGNECLLWELSLPEELRKLPEELARVVALLDDEVFFGPAVQANGNVPAVTVLEISLSAGL